jgi:hypothetical protein
MQEHASTIILLHGKFFISSLPPLSKMKIIDYFRNVFLLFCRTVKFVYILIADCNIKISNYQNQTPCKKTSELLGQGLTFVHSQGLVCRKDPGSNLKN